MIQYEEYEYEGVITIKRTDEDGKIWWIPVDESNSDYQAYLKSLEKGTIS